MKLHYLIFTLLVYSNTYSQDLENDTLISVLLLNCYEGSEMDESKPNLSEYLAAYEKVETFSRTSYRFKKYNADSIVQPRFLIKGLNLIKILTMGKWINRKMYPGETIIFSVPNQKNEAKSRTYSIYTKGKLIETKDHEFPYFEKITDYELRVAFEKTNKSIIKMDIFSFPSGGFEGGIFLYWIGDLNGDDRLDMLVGTSSHYAGIELLLYVSDKTDKALFVKHIVGSCSVD